MRLAGLTDETSPLCPAGDAVGPAPLCGRQTRRLLFSLFVTGTCARNLMRPFLPLQSEEVGIRGPALGLLFAVTPLCTALASPLVGLAAGRRGSFVVLFAAVLFLGATYTVAGLLPVAAPSAPLLFATFLLLRLAVGVGLAGVSTGTLASLAQLFPGQVGLLHGQMEMCDGVASALGNTVGGCLFRLGGWRLPCLALGGLQLFVAGALFPLVPWGAAQKATRPHSPAPGELSAALDKPARPWCQLFTCDFLFPAVAVFLAGLAFSAPDPIVPVFWARHSVSVSTTALIQAVGSLSYAISSLGWGCVTQQCNPHVLVIAGLLTCGCSFIFLGTSIAWVSAAMYLAVAVSGACLFVPTAPALLPAVHGGGPQATALAVGVMEGCYFAGEVAGPLLAEWAQLAYGVPATFALLGHLLLGCGVAYALWFFCCTPDEL
eukprot:EG_transcript_6136